MELNNSQQGSSPNARGIQNVEVQHNRIPETSDQSFERRTSGRLTQTRLRDGTARSRNNSNSNESEPDTINEFQESGMSRQGHSSRTRMVAQGIYSEEGLDYKDGDEKQLLTQRPEPPTFPFFMFFLALAKDGLDVFVLTGVGVLLSEFLSVILGIILFAWIFLRFKKLGGGKAAQKLIRKTILRFLVMLGIEVTPFIQIVPTAAAFVIMNYFSEKKLADGRIGALKKLQSKGLR